MPERISVAQRLQLSKFALKWVICGPTNNTDTVIRGGREGCICVREGCIYGNLCFTSGCFMTFLLMCVHREVSLSFQYLIRNIPECPIDI